jgi:SAM-dependent methyltransferase
MCARTFDRDWDQNYLEGQTPWDTGRPSTALVQAVESKDLTPGTLLEFGSGSGTNALFLAEHGFQVTGIDLSAVAVERAREKAALRRKQGANLPPTNPAFHMASVLALPAELLKPHDALFDRGCYHGVRMIDLPAYQKTLAAVSRPGTMFFLLAGNANEQRADQGPPVVSERELCDDLGGLFEFVKLEEFRFDDIGNGYRPLGWKVLLRRRAG